MDLIFGTTASAQRPGYSVPPGRFLIRTEIPVGDRSQVIPVPPVPITVVGAQKVE
jgi:hypothetical protein